MNLDGSWGVSISMPFDLFPQKVPPHASTAAKSICWSTWTPITHSTFPLPIWQWIPFFSFPEPSDFRLRHLGGPIIQAWTQRQHGRHQHGPDHKGIHHDAEDENKAHLVGDCHTSKHHAGLSSITARKRCNLRWVSITPVNDCQPTSANCFKKANQPSKCMEMSSFRTLILNHHFTHRQYQPANPQMFIPSIESESKDQPGCGNGRTRGRQGQLYWLVIAKALKMDPSKSKNKRYTGIPVSRNPSNTRITSYHLNLANCQLCVSVSLPPIGIKLKETCSMSAFKRPCLLSEFPNTFEEEDIIILMSVNQRWFYRIPRSPCWAKVLKLSPTWWSRWTRESSNQDLACVFSEILQFW